MKIVNKVVLCTTKFIELMKTQYINMKGEVASWNWVRRCGNKKFVIIAAIYDDKLVLIKEYRVSIEDYEIHLPAGMIDDGEDVESAAIRELKEETGLDIDEIYDTSPLIYSSTGLTNESGYIVMCSATGEISQDGNEDDEEITTLLKSQNEVSEMFLDKNLKFGAKGYLIMKMFSEYIG